ncbi:uncharacterized protein LOC135170080 [Diachasmimorpha longicaudata]|uniref:uncharacterized protein LOC135170080 n=1 Tax=Diachasmimorpha longicaudata TaxID=58733 RepID=UPI0030B8F649
MAGVYPSLHDKFRSENVCPICMMEMTGTPKFSCGQHHILCHRCKPYYHSCPTCQSPLSPEIPPREVDGGYYMPPSEQYMPHPYPPYPSGPAASAPFLDHESHYPPPSVEHHELQACQYKHLGCYARVPERLRSIHETRCQFRPNLECDHLPTDLNVDEGTLEDCKYHIAGCNVRLPVWRKLVHEKLCIYQDKMEELEGLHDQLQDLNVEDDYGDPEELVECRFSRYGCQVQMPRRRKHIHERKCNHGRDHDDSDDEGSIHIREPEGDPDEKLPCRWAEFGCQVEPRRCRKDTHEEKCNYRREHCRFEHYGCYEMMEPTKKFSHERNCRYSS